jgi:hypothetical protein
LYDLVRVATAAELLPTLDVRGGTWATSELSALVKKYRNLLHPGRPLRLDPQWSLEADESKDAKAIVVIVDYLLDQFASRQAVTQSQGDR